MVQILHVYILLISKAKKNVKSWFLSLHSSEGITMVIKKSWNPLNNFFVTVASWAHTPAIFFGPGSWLHVIYFKISIANWATSGADPERGGTPRVPPLKLERIWWYYFFLRKIVIFSHEIPPKFSRQASLGAVILSVPLPNSKSWICPCTV